jgi:hypothetical protein
MPSITSESIKFLGQPKLTIDTVFIFTPTTNRSPQIADRWPQIANGNYP